MRILVTGAGGAAAISVWKSLKNEHELHMADIDPSAAGLYLVPAKQRLLLPRGDAPDFLEKVMAACKQRQIEVIIATVDTELAPLAKHHELFKQASIQLPLSSYETLRICHDKYALLTAAKGVVPVPDVILLNDKNIDQIKTFPRFAKPRFGAGSHGIMVIHDRKELEQLPRDDSYLVQELLPGEEYSVDVYLSKTGVPIAAVPRLRMKVDSGIAVTARTVSLPDLSAAAVKLAEAINIRFVANVQFKRAQNGEFKLLEVNPRFPGTLPLTQEAGVDIPKLLMQDINNLPLPTGLMPFKEMMVVRYWTEKFCSLAEWEALCQKH